MLVLSKLDFIFTSKKEKCGLLLTFETLVKYLNLTQEDLKNDEILQGIVKILSQIKILTPDYLSECLRQRIFIEDFEKFEIKLDLPKIQTQIKRFNSGVSDQKQLEEEKLDQVVNLEDIIDDIYRMKFTTKEGGGNSSKKRSLKDALGNESKTRLSTADDGDLSSHRSFRSKFYKDGEECYSEDSYMFQWKPDYIANKEEYWDKKKDKFACSRGSTLKEDQIIEDGIIKQKTLEEDSKNKQKPLNDDIIKQIEMLQKYYDTQGDKGRGHGYRRALTFLRAIKEPIYSVDQLKEVPYLGQGILKKVKELIEEGTISRFDFLSHDESVVVTDGMQKIGLKYYDDIKQRIPRDEVTALLEKIREVSSEIFPKEKNTLKIDACGSYRRGKQSCGDIDILITRTDGSPITGIVEKLVIKLESIGFLKERLGSLRHSSTGSEGYMGMCQLTPDHLNRRIDIKAYPLSQYGFAILYFTGSGNFNRSMRLFAQKKGYSLSDQGLQPVLRVKGQKVAEFNSIPCETEEDVFKALNLDYKAPHERDI
ncbi:helix-hairpin-helix motif family protein [Stylonychia lemnae]|uniref:Helix-hairpin-helix motif family protein n=1 Tax=Stylonychia lemnae TaxID=5949 RepID=A0A077ZTC7_STYLE|nr:helix-hairpin-helix motif family protein [Stylonychia lemnae]|eukprot:CDW73148.1 helix-hairpin-helix motif family protein [Stylonychia lemnae]